MNKQNIKVNDVVQINPMAKHPMGEHPFGGCFMKIDEVFSWGVLGVVPINAHQECPTRVPFGDVHKVGEVKWDV